MIPKCNKKQVLIEEYHKYKGNKAFYPFQMYLHWNPEDVGNILNSASKFLKVLYAQYVEVSRVTDAKSLVDMRMAVGAAAEYYGKRWLGAYKADLFGCVYCGNGE